MSRRKRPKQLLPLIDGRSLLELAAGRLEGVVDPPRRLICASEAHRGAIREAIPELTDEQILGEPVGRDTVNAVGFTAAVLTKRDPDAIFAVLTADHIIEPQDEFRRKVELGFQVVEDERSRFATFSIMPTYPATAYGYVERGRPIPRFQGAYEAKRFVEKPDAKTAQAYLDAGTFGWNSGMFVFGAQEFLDALRRFKPRSYEGIARIADGWFPQFRPGPQGAEQIEKLRGYVEEAGRKAADVGIEGRVGLARESEDTWPEAMAGWRELGASHVSFNTMGAKLDSPDAHIDALRRFKEAAGS